MLWVQSKGLSEEEKEDKFTKLSLGGFKNDSIAYQLCVPAESPSSKARVLSPIEWGEYKYLSSQGS